MAYNSEKRFPISSLNVVNWEKPLDSQGLSLPLPTDGPRTLVEKLLASLETQRLHVIATPHSPVTCRIFSNGCSSGFQKLQPFSAFDSLRLQGFGRLIGLRAKVTSSRTTLREVTGEDGVDEGAED